MTTKINELTPSIEYLARPLWPDESLGPIERVKYSGGMPYIMTNGSRMFIPEDLKSIGAVNISGEWYVQLITVKRSPIR